MYVFSGVPQRSGSHERMECCFPVFPDGPPLPHSATSVPILQHSDSNTRDKHRVRLTFFAVYIGSLHFLAKLGSSGHLHRILINNQLLFLFILLIKLQVKFNL